MSAALSGGSTTLEALAEAGSGVPPQPSDIQGIMEDLAVGSQPEPGHAQQAGTEGSHKEADGGGGAESAGEPDQAQQANTEGSQAEAGGGGGAESAGEPDQAAAPSSQPDQSAS